METYLIAALLGVIEGLTEFLPISSTGHLILANHLLGLNEAEWSTFNIMIQLGAVLAIVSLYFKRLWGVLIGLPTNPQARHFALLILVALAPSLILGALFGSMIKSALFNPFVVGVTLILGGLVIVMVEQMHLKPRYQQIEAIPLKTGVMIGFAQALAMIPGTSRSGATIMGGLMLGLERRTAAEFSFFLAVPTMVAAFTHEAVKYRNDFDFSQIGIIAVGFVAAFISALLVVKPFLDIVTRHGFAPFAYYRVALGALVLTLMWL
jgi:undecaprenyl-diphosphatase